MLYAPGFPKHLLSIGQYIQDSSGEAVLFTSNGAYTLSPSAVKDIAKLTSQEQVRRIGLTNGTVYNSSDTDDAWGQSDSSIPRLAAATSK